MGPVYDAGAFGCYTAEPMRGDTGTSGPQIRTILLGLLNESLDELRRFRDIDISRVDLQGGRIMMKDGRVFSVEIKAEASVRGRQGPGRRY